MCSSMGMWTETESSIQQEWKKKKSAHFSAEKSFIFNFLLLKTGIQTNINQQLEHITCMPFCMHLSCHCRETDFCLFMTGVLKPRSLILGTVNVSWYTTSHRLSLYVLILIWSSHHSGLLSEEKKKRARCNKPCPQKQTPLWEPGSAEMKSC